ncbi:MAG: DUF4367 domain-containing protein [Oscillospiraceae bacterium]
MTDCEFTEQIRSALLDATTERWASVMEGPEELVWSPKHQRVMDKLYRDPFGTAKKRARPLWKKVLSAAACVLLVCSIALGGLLAFSPSAQAWVQQIVAQWFGEYARFSFGGNAGQETGAWKATWLPEGYEPVEEDNAQPFTDIVYENSDGTFIRLIYAPAGSSIFSTNNEHQNHEQVLVNGTTAYLSRATLQGETSYLVWTDAMGEVSFMLSTTGNAENLIPLADGICHLGAATRDGGKHR